MKQHTIDAPGIICPDCNTTLDGATGPSKTPAAGNIILCAYCASLLQYSYDGSTKTPESTMLSIRRLSANDYLNLSQTAQKNLSETRDIVREIRAFSAAITSLKLLPVKVEFKTGRSNYNERKAREIIMKMKDRSNGVFTVSDAKSFFEYHISEVPTKGDRSPQECYECKLDSTGETMIIRYVKPNGFLDRTVATIISSHQKSM